MTKTAPKSRRWACYYIPDHGFEQVRYFGSEAAACRFGESLSAYKWRVVRL